jgi:hypothetical protein
MGGFMPRKYVKFLIVIAILLNFIGCSLDRCQLISHPSSAKPNDTISVILSDIYIILSDTSITRQSYVRDSLHIVYGLPNGWSVLASDYYIASTIQINQIANIATDTSLLLKMLTDSLNAYISRKSPMSLDNSWKNYFKNKTLTAHGFALDSIRVNVDSVEQWIPYAAQIGLSFPSGTKMDTGIPLSSLPIDTSTLSATIKSFLKTYDTIWVKTVPIICFAQIIVASNEDTTNLYYFTKTGRIPSSGGISLLPNYDKGDMSYATIFVSAKNSVKYLFNKNTAHSLLNVYYQNSINSPVNIFINTNSKWRLSIFDIKGEIVKKFEQNNYSSNFIKWDKTTYKAERVLPGVYTIQLHTDNQNIFQAINILK